MRRLSRRTRLALVIANLAAIVFLVGPLVPVVVGSLQSERTMQRDVFALLPREVTLANFRLILSGGRDKGPIFDQVTYLPASVARFPSAFRNSTVVALAVTGLALAIASLSAYAIVRLPTRLTRTLFTGSVVARMVPLVVLIVPMYVLFRRYELLNTLTGVVCAEVGFLVPYAVLILAPYFAALPAELEEAARLDGCTRVGAFWRIVLPLSTPGLAACAVVLFIISWHELLIPLVLASRPEVTTLPVILSGLVSDYFVFFTLMMAICLLGMIPTVLLVLLLQRFVVRGLVAGAVRG